MRFERYPWRFAAALVAALALAGCSEAGPELTPSVDNSRRPADEPDKPEPSHNTSNLPSDFSDFRDALADGRVPSLQELDADGFIGEHEALVLPPSCGRDVCLQAMYATVPRVTGEETLALVELAVTPSSEMAVEDAPRTLAVVIDISDNVADGSAIDQSRNALRTLADELDDYDQIAVIVYAETADIVLPMGPVDGRRNLVAGALDEISPGGPSNLYAALDLGYTEVFGVLSPDRQNRVVLLTGGLPTAGEMDLSRVVALSHSYNRSGVGFSAVSFDDQITPLLRRLTEQGQGNLYYADDDADLAMILREELDYSALALATAVEVDVVSQGPFEIVRAVGERSWTATDDGGSFKLPSLFIGHRSAEKSSGARRNPQESPILLEVQPVGELDESYDETLVTTVTLRYRQLATGALLEDQLNVVVPTFTALGDADVGYFDSEIVERSALVYTLLEGLERAVDAFHTGQPEMALRVLRLTREAALDWLDSATLGVDDITGDVALIAQLADVIRSYGVADPDVDVPEDPWP